MTPKIPYNGYTKSTNIGRYLDLTVGDLSDLPACSDCSVLQDVVLLGAKDRRRLAVWDVIPLTMQINTTPCHLRGEGGFQGRREQSNKVEGGRTEILQTKERKRKKDKKDVGEQCLLLFTNVFISSLFTMMWFTVVCCFTWTSSSCSSSSSSKGFEPAGAVLAGVFRLTTRSTVRNGFLTCTHTHTQRHICDTIYNYKTVLEMVQLMLIMFILIMMNPSVMS